MIESNSHEDNIYLVELLRNIDTRGSLTELFNSSIIQKFKGWEDFEVHQVNFVISKKSVVRGIHRTKKAFSQRKIVFCEFGEITDILVDLRPESIRFAQTHEFKLSTNKMAILLIPARFGHAFQTLSNESKVIYAFDRGYNPTEELSISPYDEKIGIKWELPPILSEKDNLAPDLSQIDIEIL